MKKIIVAANYINSYNFVVEGIIPKDIFISPNGYNPDEYFTLKHPLTSLRFIELSDVAISKFGITVSSSYQDIIEAEDWEKNNPTLTGEEIPAQPHVVTLP